jgi:hypothetical protein
MHKTAFLGPDSCATTLCVRFAQACDESLTSCAVLLLLPDRYLDSKRQGGATGPSAPAPRVPALNMAALQAAGGAAAPGVGVGSSTARVAGAGAGPAAGAPPMSARGSFAGTQQLQQARGMAAPVAVSARGASAAAAAAGRGRAGGGAGLITAMAPPPPRGPAVVAAAADPQVLQRALKKQLPAFDVEEALRVSERCGRCRDRARA